MVKWCYQDQIYISPSLTLPSMKLVPSSGGPPLRATAWLHLNCSSTTWPSLPNLTGKERLCGPDCWNQSLQSWVGSEWASSWNHHRFSALTDLGYQGWSPPPRTRGLQGVEFDTIMRTADDAWSRKNENGREVTNVCYYKTIAER